MQFRERRGTPHVLAESATCGYVKVATVVVVFLHLAGKENGSVFKLLALIDGPWLAEMLAALLPYAFLVGGIKVVYLDRKFPAHVVEQHLRHFQSCRWQSTGQSRVAVRPFLFRFRQFIQRLVTDRQQPTLFEVRQRDASTLFQIPVQPVAKNGAECGLGVFQGLKSHLGIAGVQIEGQFKRLEHFLG